VDLILGPLKRMNRGVWHHWGDTASNCTAYCSWDSDRSHLIKKFCASYGTWHLVSYLQEIAGGPNPDSCQSSQCMYAQFIVDLCFCIPKLKMKFRIHLTSSIMRGILGKINW